MIVFLFAEVVNGHDIKIGIINNETGTENIKKKYDGSLGKISKSKKGKMVQLIKNRIIRQLFRIS